MPPIPRPYFAIPRYEVNGKAVLVRRLEGARLGCTVSFRPKFVLALGRTISFERLEAGHGPLFSPRLFQMAGEFTETDGTPWMEKIEVSDEDAQGVFSYYWDRMPTLLRSNASADRQAIFGLISLDPHGDIAETPLARSAYLISLCTSDTASAVVTGAT